MAVGKSAPKTVQLYFSPRVVTLEWFTNLHYSGLCSDLFCGIKCIHFALKSL